jgi:hypothetical protein
MSNALGARVSHVGILNLLSTCVVSRVVLHVCRVWSIAVVLCCVTVQAGPEGVLTPELTRRMGISPKLFLKGLPDMCKRYGVQVGAGDTHSCSQG